MEFKKDDKVMLGDVIHTVTGRQNPSKTRIELINPDGNIVYPSKLRGLRKAHPDEPIEW